jgi:NifB/MoaA-like Fe-S oxidoreductase
VCPGINDGAALDETLLGILDRFPALMSVGVVPVGISAHSREPELRPHTAADAARVLDIVERWQARFLDVLGRRLVSAADELYLLAGRPFPGLADYDHDESGGLAQHENGVGMAATFAHEVDAALRGAPVAGTGTRSGFFAWVDGAPASGYRALRVDDARVGDASSGRPVTVVTGEYGDQVLAPLMPRLAEAAGVPVRTLSVPNECFGGTIAVTGLLTGADLSRVLADLPDDHRYLLPDVVLSEGRFLDDTTPADLPRTVEVIGTDGTSLVAALR